MSGRRRSSVESQFTQSNIGKFVNISKPNKAKRVEKGETKTGAEPLNPINASTSRKVEHPLARVPKKRGKPDSRSPEEVRKPPSMRHNKPNTMAAPTSTATSTIGTEKQEKDSPSDFAELEKRLLAGFAFMIQREIGPLKQDIKEIKEEQKLNTTNTNCNSNEAISRKFNQTDEKHRKLQNRISFLEDQLLEKNVIFQGILETEYEDAKDVKSGIVRAITDTMEGDSEEEQRTNASKTSIESVERLGKYNPMRTRPVKVKFGEKRDVDNLFRNRKKLPKGVFIDKEYSKSTEKERRLLRPVIKAARRLDKYKGVCRLEGPQLVIEGKRYHRQNIHTLPEDLNPMDVTSKSDSDTLAFFGELNPFSNFHPCKFDLEGESFNSSEQYIQWTKAKYCGDRIAMERILNCEDASDCKEASRDIVNKDRKGWLDSAETLCFDGIQAKFVQNNHLMEKLLETGEKTLVEASYDETWGTGQHLGSKDCLSKNKWKSVGILGRILMRVRSDAQKTSLEAPDYNVSMETSNTACTPVGCPPN